MRRAAKVKALATRVILRMTALTASAASRHTFPAWIEADEGGVPFPAKSATPRVRDGLVLRTVSKKKSPRAKGSHHGDSTR
jgi:hypothetical protein